jgi:tetratricopeptide (TPR) repeat protein
MSALPGGTMELRAELERLADERRWGEIKDRTSQLDDIAVSSDPKIAYLVAEALVYLGDTKRALVLALAAEGEFRARHDQVNLLAALNLAGAVQFELGDLVGAEERFADLLELARERGDDEMIGRATNNLGAIASLRGDHQLALSLFRLSVPAYQNVGFLGGLAQADHNLGIVHRDLGYWREAERHYRSALRHARQLGDERLAAMSRAGRAEILHRRGDQPFAEAELLHCLQAFEEVGDELGRSDVLRLLGCIMTARKLWDEASRYFDEALRLAREYSNPLLEAEILESRADFHEETEQLALARADLEGAVATYRRLGAELRQKRAEEKLQRVAA